MTLSRLQGNLRVMARPAFAPTPHQAALQRALTRQAERIAEDDARFTALIAEAKDDGVPIEHIARAAHVTVKTVYARLARTAETDQGGRSSR